MNDSPVMWGQVYALSGIALAVLGGLAGWVLKSLTQLGTKVDNHQTRLDETRIEFAKTYATIEAVVAVEQRLTASINRLSDQIGESLNHLTERLEALFLKDR